MNIDKFNKEFITDSKGNKKAVIISIEEYSRILEDIEDLAAIAERREETTNSMEEVIKELKKNGFL